MAKFNWWALKNYIVSKPIFRPALSVWFGSKMVYRYFGSQLLLPYVTIFKTGELHNFSYDLTEQNRRYLTEMIALVTAKPRSEIATYIDEIRNDRELAEYMQNAKLSGQSRKAHWTPNPFGRRYGWYAIARAVKPKIVVETGVERGHGSVLLCAALARNAVDGFDGRYYGLDIDPTAGGLLGGKYREFGELLYGDSVTSLRKFPHTIDLFINDSDHSAEYEAEEYRTIVGNLSKRAIVLGDNAHATDKLARFAEETKRSFLFFHEVPDRHWYPGAGIGIAFRPIG